MKAFVSLLGTLLVLSCTSFGQKTETQRTAPSQPTATSPGPLATPPTEAAATTDSSGVTSARLVPGAKLFLEPMDGFDPYLAAAIVKKKVPVVVVDDRAKADFVVTGEARVETPGMAKAVLVSPAPHGKASISIKDARTGALVLEYKVSQSDPMMTWNQISQSSAEACAQHLKKVMQKK